ncbi:MAG: hypothetical protein FJX25_10355 [Alphaproteobacteria bacterium]|nr:hypothetical protein [Alphaproteobacteria bacterium]
MIDTFEIDGFAVGCHGAMAEIAQTDWDGCDTEGHSLLQHRHLRILEECGIAVPAAGFHPHHLVLTDACGQVVGAAPTYLKTSSAGEMGVDLGLPLAHLRAAGPYYPKLQVEVPMIPNPGPRLLVRPGANRVRVQAALIAALQALAGRLGASSVQIAHMAHRDQQAATGAGFLPNGGNVFVWHSRGATSFPDLVASMTQNGRTRVRKERKRIAELGLRFERLQGDAITADMAPRMFDFYKATYDRYATTPPLNPQYFKAVLDEMRDVVNLSVAFRDDYWEAVLMSFVGSDRILAEFWGLATPTDGLLFEMYYREMEFALANGLEAIDFGSTGHHKILRGIGIEATRHALWFRDRKFGEAAAAACRRRLAAATEEREAEGRKLPFSDKSVHTEEAA